MADIAETLIKDGYIKQKESDGSFTILKPKTSISNVEGLQSALNNKLATSDESTVETLLSTLYGSVSALPPDDEYPNLATQEDIDELRDTKVDKVDGKGLSTNDYDDTEKAKVDTLVATSAHQTTDGTVLSYNADYAEIGEWSDGNPNNEDRIGYFVSVDKTEAGITMLKATSTSDVRGVTMVSPGFAANATNDKFDSDGHLLAKYSYVGFAGFVPVIDNGTCTINGRCVSADDGTAIPSPNTMGYQVIDRIDSMRVLILVEPSADMLVRIKDDVTVLETDKADKSDTHVDHDAYVNFMTRLFGEVVEDFGDTNILGQGIIGEMIL